jgi:type IV pilus assembly protein PilC
MSLFQGGRERILQLAQMLPFTKHIHYAMSASRLTYGLEMMTASGVSMSEALKKSGILVTNESLKQKLPPSLEAVEGGEDIGKALAKNQVFTGYQSQIMISASRSGQMESAMRKLSELYATETADGINGLLGMLEPALVGIVSIFIGAVLLSIMFPLTRIIGGF